MTASLHWKGDCIGIYFNPGNSGFQRIVNSEYVDKTGLISRINESVNTVNNLICISRPRRFGKSYAAQMLCAYYDCSCDSHSLFDDKEIAGTEGYLAHLNQYHVLNLDITAFLSEAQRKGIPQQALRYVIKFAYIAAMGQYLKVEELPSGKGIADVVYLPKRKSMLPAMIVELKWDTPSEGAIRQIKDRNYPAVLQDYGGEIVMVGINYHSKTKSHICEIGRI